LNQYKTGSDGQHPQQDPSSLVWMTFSLLLFVKFVLVGLLISPFFGGGVNQLGSADRDVVVSDLAVGECNHFASVLSLLSSII
jgi:hypothetical protein